MLRIWLERGGRVKLDQEITTEEIYKGDYKHQDINIEVGQELTLGQIDKEIGMTKENGGYRINNLYFLNIEIERLENGKYKIVSYEIE